MSDLPRHAKGTRLGGNNAQLAAAHRQDAIDAKRQTKRWLPPAEYQKQTGKPGRK